METNQTAQMVAWLDEERRKDKALITKLEERNQSQTALLEDQTRRIQALENELVQMRQQQISANRFDETVERLRTEFNAQLEELQKRRATVDQDFKKMRDMDREALMKSIEELRQEVIQRVDRAIQPRRTEEERLSRVATELQDYASNLSKGLEDFERSLGFLEEQRRQDARRLSDINGELAELAKKSETHQAKAELLEDLSRRNERAVTELNGTVGEFRQQRQEWNEQQALSDQQRERTMNDMLKRMDGFADDMTLFSKQVESWADTNRQMKQKLEDFDRLADRVERRLNEAAEMQRLSEERFRQEWEDFMSDDQRRWRQFTITNEESWRENEKALTEIQATMTQVNELSERQSEHLKYLNRTQQELMAALAERYSALREQIEESQTSLPALS